MWPPNIRPTSKLLLCLSSEYCLLLFNTLYFLFHILHYFTIFRPILFLRYFKFHYSSWIAYKYTNWVVYKHSICFYYFAGSRLMPFVLSYTALLALAITVYACLMRSRISLSHFSGSCLVRWQIYSNQYSERLIWWSCSDRRWMCAASDVANQQLHKLLLNCTGLQ